MGTISSHFELVFWAIAVAASWESDDHLTVTWWSANGPTGASETGDDSETGWIKCQEDLQTISHNQNTGDVVDYVDFTVMALYQL